MTTTAESLQQALLQKVEEIQKLAQYLESKKSTEKMQSDPASHEEGILRKDLPSDIFEKSYDIVQNEKISIAKSVLDYADRIEIVLPNKTMLQPTCFRKPLAVS